MEKETVRDFIIRILQEQHRNELEGKGYDFYFVLRNELDKLNNLPHSTHNEVTVGE